MASQSLVEQLRSAVLAHAAWKSRLSQAIETGTSEFKVAIVRQDNQCPFGKWLYTEIDPAARRSVYYEQVRSLHAEFHKAASNVLGLATSAHKAEALAAMSPASDYVRVSNQLTARLTAWQAAG